VSCRARPPAPAPAESNNPAGPRPKKKSKKLVDLNGDVLKDLGNGMFQIKLENGVGVMGHLSGKIRQNRIRIVTGDKVGCVMCVICGFMTSLLFYRGLKGAV